MHLVKIACERPDDLGRSLSHWDCAELARQLVTDEVVETISPQTVQRMLANHKLKPWRKHLWLSPKVPRDAEFCRRVKNICSLYTRKLKDDEVVLCVDEKTSLQPRTRKSPTLAAQPGLPVHSARQPHPARPQPAKMARSKTRSTGRAEVCVGMTPTCRRHCYAVRTEQYRLKAKAHYEANLRLTRRRDFARRVWAFLIAHHCRVVRVHTGGEFYSAQYARKWQKIIRRSPRVKFFTYTRA